MQLADRDQLTGNGLRTAEGLNGGANHGFHLSEVGRSGVPSARLSSRGDTAESG
ncbi:Uncharacterised protein [Mycobacteroides abscessus subsp. abscessus]|nr:Uncharacterised protein [Mycobacteroides abscessus subsp. abscessus]